ncbi:uncharacterized protein BDV14DRAFT_206779 [Aspergillus stella-maris]|uniref:uncharacterized protein n=1 Tax=Aspergillus stella-maris TaxID=1810926 RepID=UPI003CCCC32A
MPPKDKDRRFLSARELVEQIADQHGHLGEDVLSQMTPEVRKQVEKALLMKDGMIGSSVVTLAKNLYNSTARFIFELLQNADDNAYTVAHEKSEDPFVLFRVYDGRIVVECNEDGFTHDNLVAICNVGKSSKTGAQGYIGEKGIGFKSVFMVAWKVHIQSGDFSFSFRHKKGDSGMGMISPVWEESEDVLPRHLTRITLYLHDTELGEAAVRHRETTLQQLSDMKPEFLLFMKNVRRIEVKMYDDSESVASSTSYSMQDQWAPNQVRLKEKTQKNGELQEEVRYYHITKHSVSDLPKSENRQYTNEEVNSRSYAKSEVMLAFPSSKDAIPIIQRQDLYAFLPVRNMGLSFLVQADFVTDASRQDIVRSSARNIALLPEIAQAFVQTVQVFCLHPILRRIWMRYIPNVEWNSADRYWTTLVEEIRSRLLKVPTLFSRSKEELHAICDMRILPSAMCDRFRAPLLPDRDAEQYLSPLYRSEDLNLLKGYGLRRMSKKEFVLRVDQDLECGPRSIMRNSETNDDWHTRTAKVLLDALEHGNKATVNIVERLEAIPVVGGNWGSSNSIKFYHDPIYFPHVHGYQIPTVGTLPLVDPLATSNSVRKGLFEKLGVQSLSVQEARSMVLQEATKRQALSTEVSRGYLHFLYCTAHLDRENDNPEVYGGLMLFTKTGQLKSTSVAQFYFPDNDPYGCEQLLVGFDEGSSQSSWNSVAVKPMILRRAYLAESPMKPTNETRTWIEWLIEVHSIRDVLPLTRGRALSSECHHVAKRYPKKFLPFLLRSWKYEGEQAADTFSVSHALRDIKVPCENGELHPLGQTYIHDSSLAYADEYLQDGESFPWLMLDKALVRLPQFVSIECLTEALSFGYPSSELEFCLTILRAIADANEDATKTPTPSRIMNLYTRIMNRHNESVASSLSAKSIVSAFCNQSLIYAPAYGSEKAAWAPPCLCLWDAPIYFQHIYPLKPLYEREFPTLKGLDDLFHDILGIANADVDDFISELETINETCGDVEFASVVRVYEDLNKIWPQVDEAKETEIRNRFERGSLIFHEGDGSNIWYKPSECLWSEVTDIRGMVSLNDVYDDLSEFFTELLGVRTLSLQMVIDKLVEQGRGEGSIDEVKETIWLLNSYLHEDDNHPDPTNALNSKVFPVKSPDGSVELCNHDVEFAVADRKHLSSLFAGKARFLDFSVNEVARLEPFLKWTGLNRQCLSSSVKEISSLRADSSERLVPPERNISKKAYGLLRIAVHYNSPRLKDGDEAFYNYLKLIECRETDGIVSELHLNQNGTDFKVEVKQSELHFQEFESHLVIYVPRDMQAQYLCFLDRIPPALVEWVMTDPSTGICDPFNEKAVGIVSTVLQARPKYMGLMLDRAGIMSVDMPDESSADSGLETPNDAFEEALTPISGGRSLGNDIGVRDTTQPTRIEDANFLRIDEYTSVTRSRPSTPSRASSRVLFTPQSTPRGASFIPPELPILDQPVDGAYLDLLHGVVNAARHYTFPTKGTSNMDALGLSLNDDCRVFQLRGLDKNYRDTLIGAAGELFVFETLSRLNPRLPGFSRENWKSTIRKHVNIHEDYTDLEPWNGRETADITYNDTESILTSVLIDKGYLDSIWLGTKPRFYLEVKATTYSCDEPFYMSKHQFERMNNMSAVEPNQEDARLYIIFRVYNLGRDDVRMQIYVNPGLMRERGELLFTAGTWSVLPGPQIHSIR